MKIDHRPWRVPPEVLDPLGRPAGENREFFVSPSPSLGRVVTAWSDVKPHATLWPLWFKLVLAALVCALGICGLIWLKMHSPPGQKPGTAEVLILCASLGLPILSLAFALKKKYIAFIGDKGAAVYATRGSRAELGGQEIQYGDVVDVQIKRTPYSKGRTEMKIRCVDAGGKVLLTLRGYMKQLGGRKIYSPPYIIASAVNGEWRKCVATQPIKP